MTKSLQGKTALVTGGGGGIGSAICRRLASEGASVIITYSRNQAKAQTLADGLDGDTHLVIQASVDNSEHQAILAQSITDKYGKLDILVNNAGVTQPIAHDDLDSLTDEIIDHIFRVNVRGAIASIRAMKHLLLQSDDALVINISSIAARTAVGSNVAYCASKAAMDSTTMSLARALAPDIRVVSVSPGWVNGDYAQRMPPEIIQKQHDLTPLGRIAEAEDVADAIIAVVTHLRFTTGAIIPVDGGRPLR